MDAGMESEKVQLESPALIDSKISPPLIGVNHESKEILLFSPSDNKIVRYHVNGDYWTYGEAPDVLCKRRVLKFGYVLVDATLYWLNSEMEACAYNLSDYKLYKSKGPLDFLKDWCRIVQWECSSLSHLTGDEFCLVFYEHPPGYTLVYCMKLHISHCIDKDTKFLSVSLKSAGNYYATFPLQILNTLLVASKVQPESPALIDSKISAHEDDFLLTSNQVVSSRTYKNQNEAGDDSNDNRIDIYDSQVSSRNTQLKLWFCWWMAPFNVEWYCIDLGEDDDNFHNLQQLQKLLKESAECLFEEGHDTSYMQHFGLEIKNMISDPRITDNGPCVATGSRIYYAGGKKSHGDVVRDELYVLDTSITPLRWKTATKMHMPRVSPLMAVLDGKIFIIGGLKEFKEFEGYCEIFDTHENKAVRMACLPHPFMHFFIYLALIGVNHESKEILLFSRSDNKLVRYHVNGDYWTYGEAPDGLCETRFLQFGYVLAGATLYWLNSKMEACAYNLSDYKLYRSKGPLDFLKDWYRTVEWESASLCHLTGDEFCLVFYLHPPGYTLVYCMKLQISHCIDKDTKFLSVSLKSAVNYYATFPLQIFNTLLVASEKTGNQEASTSPPTILDN